MLKYNKLQKIKEDTSQAVFVLGHAKLKPQVKTEVQVTTGNALCPFCFYIDDTSKFVVSTKSGFHKKLGKCPRCQNQSNWTTLKRKWTPETFADWCFAYSMEGFWSKVKFPLFNSGLRILGWIDPFWLRYKQLKGEVNDTESYAEHLERQQREEATENGWITA